MDLVDDLLGGVDEVSGTCRSHATYDGNIPGAFSLAPDTWDVEMRSRAGAVFRILVSYGVPLVDDMMIVGTNGIIRETPEGYQFCSPRDSLDEEGRFVRPPRIDLHPRVDAFEEGMHRAMAYFVSLVRARGEVAYGDQIRSLRVTAHFLRLSQMKHRGEIDLHDR